MIICAKTQDSLELSKNIILELKNEKQNNLKQIGKLNNIITENTELHNKEFNKLKLEHQANLDNYQKHKHEWGCLLSEKEEHLNEYEIMVMQIQKQESTLKHSHIEIEDENSNLRVNC